MTLWFNLIAGKIRRRHVMMALWIAIGLIGGAMVLPPSFLSSSNVLLGFCLAPFALLIEGKQRVNYVYLLLVIVFAATAWLYHVRMFYFFALAFYILVLLEVGLGRINLLMLFLLGFMSPFFQQVSVILGFPIRLRLSEWAGQLLTWGGMDVSVEGNMMSLNGAGFTVDDACMGLNMLAISLLLSVFIIAWHCRIRNKRVPFSKLAAYFTFTFLLNILSNLLRIVLLVALGIGPANPMHEGIGILCLLAYVVVPLHFVGGWVVAHWGRTYRIEDEPMTFTPVSTLLFTGMAVCMIFTGSHVRARRASEVFAYADVRLDNYSPVRINKGITKISSPDMLVYVKPIPEFFSGEHIPLLCWQGSGYNFQHIRSATVNNKEIYLATMEKPGAHLFTAWWYTNGKVHTIDQVDWRLRMLKGEDKFCLVNVTASDESGLMQKLKSLLGDKPLIIHPHGV